MSLTTCSNCDGPLAFDDVLITHQHRVIGGICAKCVSGVKKPRITLVRATREGRFDAEQYSAVEMFK
jgi:hypothetical protein